jgi:DsbC/DsbD-like thiol-disulfide interchange protein
MFRGISVLSAALLIASAAWANAQSFKAQSFSAMQAQQHAMVSLVAERSAAVPGQTLSVGLRFELDPHWHIYWRNPGDSGGPPTIEWKLPEGFQAGEFEWPAPRRIAVGETVVNYGYEADVLLPLTLRVPASAKPGTQVDLAGHVKYLICSELCVPAKADVKLTIPIAASNAASGADGAKGASGAAAAPSPSAPLFADARKRTPQPAPSSWKTHATLANRQFDLAIDTGKREPAAGATFFPLTASQIDDSAPQQATPTARGIRLTLRASDQLTAAPRTLSGVLVLANSQAYTINAPVTGSP